MSISRHRIGWAIGAVLLASGACTPAKAPDAGGGASAAGTASLTPLTDSVTAATASATGTRGATSAPGDTGAGARDRIARLERDARALAKTTGCTSAASCRTAPVGWRACGGPRSYVTYCAATTDSVALFRALAELESAEKRYLETTGAIGTCEYRMPPGVRLTGGSCTEAPAGPRAAGPPTPAVQ